MTTNSPLISLIIPVYNTEAYLRECVDSARAQTYRNIEILLVDDGSDAPCRELCDALSREDERIRVIHQQNAGLGMARNRGLETCQGEYVTFPDSDDTIAPDFVEKLYKRMEETNADVCICGFQYTDGEGKIIDTRHYEEALFKGAEGVKTFAARMIGSLPDKKDSFEMSVCAALYRMEVIRKNGLRFHSERELISEDLCFNLDYAQVISCAATVSHAGYRYRTRMDSLSRVFRSERMERCCEFYGKMKEKLTEYGYPKDAYLRLDRMLFINARVCIRQAAAAGRMDGIRAICRSKLLREVICAHPLRKLNLSQRVFLMLIQMKMAGLLWLLSKVGLC